MGLPKCNRLQRRDFRTVYRQGFTRHSPHLKLKALPARRQKGNSQTPQPLPASQFGLTVSRKVGKKAVTRNRLKRQLRAALRQLLPEVKPGWKMVFVAKPGASECKYEHFLRELKQLLSQAEALDGHQRKNIL